MFPRFPRVSQTLLGLLAASSLAGCFAGGDGPGDDIETQVIRGSVPLSHYSTDIVGVRVLSGTEVVSTAATDANGNFSIAVPIGTDYSFEIVGQGGTHVVLTGPIDGHSPMHFNVCDPGEDFDLGDINPIDFEEIDGDETPWTPSDDECGIPPWLCEDGTSNCWDEPLPCTDPASSPDFCWDEPLPCDAPGAEPSFCWEDPCDEDGTCTDEPPLPCEEGDPDCWPVPCDTPSGFGCEDPCLLDPTLPGCLPCDPASDPTCGEPPPPPPCEDGSADCWPEPCDDPSGIGCHPCELDPFHPDCWDPKCEPGAQDCGEPPPPPCEDGSPECWPEPCVPGDPACDIDPCELTPDAPGCWDVPPCDPASDPTCAEPPVDCPDGISGPDCWPEPEPEPCTITPAGDFIDCDSDIGGAPEVPFPDFGCEETPL